MSMTPPLECNGGHLLLQVGAQLLLLDVVLS
jgi:hypothetical protein